MRPDVVTIQEYNDLVKENFALKMELKEIRTAYAVLQDEYDHIKRDADLGQTTRKFLSEIKQIMR